MIYELNRNDSAFVHQMVQRFNIDGGGLRADAGETVFFARELEQILTENFDVKYAALKSRLMVPTLPVDPGAESVTYRQFDSVGEAKAIVDGSKDLPMVNVMGTESTQRMQSYGDAFGYSIGEIRAAARAGRPLERQRATAARRVLDQKLDKILATGDSTFSLNGLLGLSNTTTYTTPAGDSGSKAFTAKTPDEVLADLNGMVRKVIVDTKEVEQPTRIVLPTDAYQHINTKARSALSDTTILSFFKGTNPGIEVMSWERLALAGSGGTVSRAIAYDPRLMNVHALMAIEFEMLAPQLDNYTYKVNCSFRTGGVVSPFPKSICYADEV